MGRTYSALPALYVNSMQSTRKSAFRVGLTGGIASGKSSVAKAFSNLGIITVSADVIARDLLNKGSETLNAVIAELGSDLLAKDGNLDRNKLRNLIFNNPDARKQLDSITHPAIGERLLKAADRATSPYVILEIPLLVEADMMSLVNRVLVVDIDMEEQIKRIILRDNSTRIHAEKIISAQISAQTRLAAADDIIHNNGTLAKLSHQVGLLHNKYLKLAELCISEKPDSTEHPQMHGIGLDLH